MNTFSIILPARNEADNLTKLLPQLCERHPHSEIIVVDDGSTDNTAEVCSQFPVRVVAHPYGMGNGAAVKSGARHATRDVMVFMDADGQHDPQKIDELVAKLEQGYEMAVGARLTRTHASLARRIANFLFNRLASVMTGHKIEDLTSGFRAVRRRHFNRFLYLYPNGFSYPTTCTMAFFRSGLAVAYVPIEARQRGGRSHIKLLEDGLRFYMIILKIGALFSPMRLFLPISMALFAIGLSYYLYTYITVHRFTNMSALLLTTAIITFLIGILAELVSALHFKDADTERRLIVREPNRADEPDNRERGA